MTPKGKAQTVENILAGHTCETCDCDRWATVADALRAISEGYSHP